MACLLLPIHEVKHLLLRSPLVLSSQFTHQNDIAIYPLQNDPD